MAKATFGAGCFWHVEESFHDLKGLSKTTVGYSGGSVANPTYEQVCAGRTGHAEVVEVEFDPSKITYDELLDVFWSIHDASQMNRQGPDIGLQYRSVIFYHNPEQLALATASKERLQKAGKRIATAIEPAGPFYRAEEYHQCYFKKK